MNRVGVDIGGTFTDVVLETGQAAHSAKVLTDHAAPEQAILDGLAEVVGKAGIEPGDISVVIHGTTLATNALIERRGARTAFITTRGFRDTIEMRTESRFEQYDLDIVLPAPLIARKHRFVLDERIDADGNILRPLDDGEVRALADRITAAGFESVAIGFIHSYVNGAHERRVRDILLECNPKLSISISSEVSPQMRELERFNTVCANAFVKPQMASYLGRLVSRLKRAGTTCPVFLMHSGGGIISVGSAVEFPVRLVESGPAGGAIFAAHIASRYQLDQVLSFDMGGTTAKICLIENQTPKTAKTFEVARTYRFKKGSGTPISIPVIEMVEIGAGGGSIAVVDAMRRIQVGPESAGSEPGPACYQNGGAAPTVTDADLQLGRLDPDDFAGGSIMLSQPLGQQAIVSAIGDELGLTGDEAAYGICEMVDENMANAARVHAVENGKDISGFTMIAFGGAAPLHATRLCEKLKIRQLLVPPGASVGSAIGFLRSAFAYESVRSAYLRLSGFDAGEVNAILRDLGDEAEGFARAGLKRGEQMRRDRWAYMRYSGQGWEIPVEIADGEFSNADAARFRAWFEAAYTQLFGRPVEDLDIEIVSWSVRASTPLPAVEHIDICAAAKTAKPGASRRLFDPAAAEFQTAAVVERTKLLPGMAVAGPAVIAEPETSTIIASDFEAVMQHDGCLLVRAKPGGKER